MIPHYIENEMREMAISLREEHKSYWTAAEMLEQAAETEAARAREVCEMCRFADKPEGDKRLCYHEAFYGLQPGMHYISVPLTIKGKPYGCRGWQAREDGTR